ncbi:hypothetical protein EN35_35510 [Rhodococcus qingshengii]|nr:hypothetical protein EN35_35510 [Rhodococcus qingshengii]
MDSSSLHATASRCSAVPMTQAIGTVADIGLWLATPALLGATTLAVAADLPLSRAYPISPDSGVDLRR